jgi:gamma-D-glutamyl-L-lysine dipeptidyl-peptidase
MNRLRDLVARVSAHQELDARRVLFDVTVEQRGDGYALIGTTTERAAADELAATARRLLGSAALHDEIVRLPHPALGVETQAVAHAAITPVYAEPRLPAPQTSQLVMGMRVDVLERSGSWLRIRTEDAYLGWVHSGYITPGPREWTLSWERGSVGEPVVSLGAEIGDVEGGVIARAPWGARLIRLSPLEYRLPDGRSGVIRAGEVVDVDRLSDRFPLRGDSIVRTARRWLGAPYLWGGLTLGGADCSGFTQAVYWMHGIALPRDSDLQARVGASVPKEEGFAPLRPGDLLFFAEASTRISHVAISLGGAQIVHSAVSNGGVAFNDLDGDQPLERRLKGLYTHARRLLPD